MAMKRTYRVRLKQSFSAKDAAEKKAELVKKKGIPAVVVKLGSGYAIQIGAFSVCKNAEKRMKQANAAGFESYYTLTPVEKKGADKVLDVMWPYVDSKNAHSEFVKDYNKFIDIYNKEHKTNHGKVEMSDAWCTEFVDLMFYKAGYLDLIGYAKSSGTLVENAKKRRIWKAGSDDIRFGDVVIYKDSHGDPNHTEFAIGPNDFISGNYKGGVHKRHRSSLKTVKGRIRPKYPE